VTLVRALGRSRGKGGPPHARLVSEGSTDAGVPVSTATPLTIENAPASSSSPTTRPVSVYDLAVVKSYIASAAHILERIAQDGDARAVDGRRHLDSAADELDALTTILRRGADQHRAQEARRGRR
jgi:hypothetical protein